MAFIHRNEVLKILELFKIIVSDKFLSQVALQITRHDGQPLKSLTSVVFEQCLQILTQPGFPDQVNTSLLSEIHCEINHL